MITRTVLILYSTWKFITRITWLPKLTPKVLDPRSSIFSSLFGRNIVKYRSSLKEVFCKKSAHKVLLKISQNSKENTCPRVSFLIILFAYFLKIIFCFKKSLWHSCFPVWKDYVQAVLRSSFSDISSPFKLPEIIQNNKIIGLG